MYLWDLTTHDLEVHKPTVLHSDDGAARGIALELPSGEQLQEHETRESAWVVVVAGDVEVQGAEGSKSAGPGTVLHFEAHERREITATSDARLLMVLAPWPAPDHQVSDKQR